ncbi:MAG: hypothetical protein ABF629_09240, partial [Sporolactobacillus sp.]
LGTPPAFVLSQDQTLQKVCCILTYSIVVLPKSGTSAKVVHVLRTTQKSPHPVEAHKIHSKIELIMGFKTLISRLAFVQFSRNILSRS